jgi:hypothetical protein
MEQRLLIMIALENGSAFSDDQKVARLRVQMYSDSTFWTPSNEARTCFAHAMC